jgi:hypothetical protein
MNYGKRSATSPKENLSKKVTENSPDLTRKMPQDATNDHETKLDVLVKIEFETLNGKPYYGQISDDELIYIWVSVFKRKKEELFGVTSTKTLTRNVRATFKLNLPIKLQELSETSQFVYQKHLDDGSFDEISGKILGYDAQRAVQLGELTKVRVKTNFGIEAAGVLSWLKLYGTVTTSKHDFKVNPQTGLKTDVFEAEIVLKRHIDEYLPMFGQKAIVQYPGIPQMCNRCYTSGHLRRECNNIKKDWIVYVIELTERLNLNKDLIGSWRNAIARWKNANRQ